MWFGESPLELIEISNHKKIKWQVYISRTGVRDAREFLQQN